MADLIMNWAQNRQGLEPFSFCIFSDFLERMERTGIAWKSSECRTLSVNIIVPIRYRFPRLFLLLFLQLGWACYVYRPVRLLTESCHDFVTKFHMQSL